jgi:hypothetical protein
MFFQEKKMNKKWLLLGITGLALALGLIICGCPNPVNETNQAPIPNPSDTPVLITYGVILDNLYKGLIQRTDNEVETPELATTSDNEYVGEKMGQVANCQYVCNAINAYANKNFQPATGTAQQMVNTEYLLKMVDKANNNSSSYGTGTYATKQIVDTIAVNDALRLIILFQPQTWSTPGTYQIELPAGTYEMTAVGGNGGDGGFCQITRNNTVGGYGYKGIQTFTINSTTTIIVIVGGNGARGENGQNGAGGWGGNGGAGGTPGNGNNGNSGTTTSGVKGGGGGGGGGSSGIQDFYYVTGGNGGKGSDGNAGGKGGSGGGGSLSGTNVNSIVDSSNAYVKIERV